MSAARPVHREQTIFGRPISHIGYAVKSIPQTVDLWSRAFGAGPFYTVDDVVFDEVTHRDGPAVFEHSSAFGQWGDITVELWEVRKLEPKAAFGPRLNPINQLNHVAYWVDDVEVETERLEQLGFPFVLGLTIERVDLSVRVHDAPLLGHVIELEKDSQGGRRFFAAIAAGADGWDGARALRSADELAVDL